MNLNKIIKCILALKKIMFVASFWNNNLLLKNFHGVIEDLKNML
tara:strand:- start:313 stop:444 length:132 start_codon:yes stop_codon:yes gene_type:complete